MDGFQKKQVNQAVLFSNINPDVLIPISNDTPTSLLPLCNVPLLDYALESLNRSGIEEVFVYAYDFINDVKEHIKKGLQSHCSWSVNMSVKVLGGDNFSCLGDVLRDLYSTSSIRGNFVLMSTDTVTNANLTPLIEEHKKRANFDKGTAMTVVFKEVSTGLRSGDEVMIAMDSETNRLHFYQKVKSHQQKKERAFEIPLEVFLNNSEVGLHHNLLDPYIAICSPAMLSLFTDNFDFQHRDDFIRGLLINEEILDSRIYVSLLPTEQYARKAATNWQTYQIVSTDVINRWVYPLVPDMGICCLWQNYLFLRNNIYKSPKASVAKVKLRENIVIQDGTMIDTGSDLIASVIGRNCKIGKNCTLKNAFLFNGVVVEDDCTLEYCVIGNNSRILRGSILKDAVMVGSNVVLPEYLKLSKTLIQSTLPEDETNPKKLGDKAFILNDMKDDYVSDSEDDEPIAIPQGIPKVSKLPYSFEDSEYNSSSEEDESREGSPIQEDTNIFLSEVIDSLTRGFNEKSNPDFLVLEINSSRYAYNMTLNEVNFFVVKAVFMLDHVKSSPNVLTALHQVLSYLEPVVKNYIKTDDAMSDCLKAVEECCIQHPALRAKAAQIVHYLYDKEVVSEDAILDWHSNLDEESQWLKDGLKKLVDWLMQTSEEESTDE